MSATAKPEAAADTDDGGVRRAWRPVLAIVGATATGKSDLAMAIAERLDGEIVNADALQVYRGLDIGTAKPSLSDRERVRHHLIDVLDPEEAFSAGHFARLARRAIRDIQSRGRAAIVVGGSGLYQRALFEGLAEIPQVSRKIKVQLTEDLRSLGLAALREELAACDRSTFERLEPGDTQRVLRALEVWRGTGVALSDWLRKTPSSPGIQRLRVGLTLDRAVLYDAIESRVRRMVSGGWVDEVRRLLESAPACAVERASLPAAFQAIGYREWTRHVRGEIPFEQALSEIILATRRYAKRQETWFRREADIRWYDARTARDELPEICELFNSLVWGGS